MRERFGQRRMEEAKSVWERFGRRRIFGGIAAAAALGIGALAVTLFGMRRRAATEDAGGESNGTVGERFGEDREEAQEAALPKEELVRRAQEISRGPARESHDESERTDTASQTEQEEVSGGSARGDSQESERTDAASETEQEVQRYLKDVQYPASKDELVSAARSNDAPEELIKKLVALTIREYSDLEDVAVAADNLGGSGG